VRQVRAVSDKNKKDPYRFCIKLNERDPRQVQVANILNEQGRGMAQYISNAVLHYYHCDKDVQSADAEAIFLQTLIAAMGGLLDEKLKDLQGLTKITGPKEIKTVIGQNISLGEKTVDAEMKKGIQGALKGFMGSDGK